ncbi:hypothetical protein [Deinococcus sonorensis]|uniref:Uncharacterized protein n=2 Tax=Deinococcus sonorensis TaxID=309891 RepID=A0AAU7U6X8_9DEIO
MDGGTIGHGQNTKFDPEHMEKERREIAAMEQKRQDDRLRRELTDPFYLTLTKSADAAYLVQQASGPDLIPAGHSGHRRALRQRHREGSHLPISAGH